WARRCVYEPVAGGSSDAAAVLWGLNQMYGLGLSRKELMERGVRLGADVPYCVLRGTALAEGIGEKLKVLPPMPKCYILIAKPGINVSTRFVYENLHANDLRPEQHPDVDAVIGDIRDGDLAGLCAHMGNVLEKVTVPAHPVIDRIKKYMIKGGALGAMMSGSGPSVFGIFDTQGKARKAYRAVKAARLAKQVYLTVPYNVRRQ
ncbi:MAG: 4-(cytidine 5'-diphospho)-2-C-methyl-D-erythritol kinase, partial [Lachnospiraceae bacterium]